MASRSFHCLDRTKVTMACTYRRTSGSENRRRREWLASGGGRGGAQEEEEEEEARPGAAAAEKGAGASAATINGMLLIAWREGAEMRTGDEESARQSAPARRI